MVGKGAGSSIADDDLREIFRDLLDSETDIAIHDLHLENATLGLVYEIPHEFETQAGTDETTRVNELFLEIVDDGWDVDRFSAVVYDSQGEGIQYHIDGDVARAFISGEMDGEEFGNHITSTYEDAPPPADLGVELEGEDLSVEITRNDADTEGDTAVSQRGFLTNDPDSSMQILNDPVTLTWSGIVLSIVGIVFQLIREQK